MNKDKAKILLDYARSSSTDKVGKGLREIKKRLVISSENLSVFIELGIGAVLRNLLHNSKDNILLSTLSILSICLSSSSFRREFHSSASLSQFLSHLKREEAEDIRWRLCRAIGLQSLHGPSCIFFHENRIAALILEFLKGAEVYEAKEAAIKALRLLGNSREHCKKIFKENGVSIICEIGIKGDSLELCRVTIKTLGHFLQLNHPSFFEQLLSGTSNLKSLVEVYNLSDGELHNSIMSLFISITLFSIHSSRLNENLCIKLVEYLCYEKVLLHMANDLKHRLEVKDPNPRLTLAFCGLCGKRSNWKVTLQQVLHEKIWYQLTECNGVALFVALLAEHKDNLALLEPILRGLLGVEIIHSLRVLVLKEWLTARLLPMMKEIFTYGLDRIRRLKKESGQACCHVSFEPIGKRKGSYSDTLRKKMRKNSFIVIRDCNNINTSSNPQGSGHLGQDNLPRVKNSQILPNCADANNPSLEGESTTDSYQSSSDSLEFLSLLSRDSTEDLRDSQNDTEASSIQSFSSSVYEDPEKMETEAIVADTPDSSQASDEVESPTQCKSRMEFLSQLSTNEGYATNDLRYWNTILEYILRLLYQIVLIKGDISLICREFFPLICEYMSTSQVVHCSAINITTEIARKSSCIQPLLDTLLIPSMAVELKAMATSTDCSQCQTISEGIEAFFVELRRFFTHRHQYGRCEISDRLQPSKDLDVKHKCLLAMPHIVKCPRLLNSLLQQDRGIEDLLKLLENSPDDTSVNSLSGAALSILISTLKVEYDHKKQNLCIFCASNFDSLYGDTKFTKEEKRQLLILTNSKYSSKSDSILCLLEESKDKNLSLRSGGSVVEANREFLSAKNEVLRAMLSGHFSESLLAEVEIKDMDTRCLKMMIHFLYGCTCQTFENADLDSYLELIFVSQMYFIPTLGILAAHHLCSLILAEDIFSVLEKVLPVLEDEILQHLICAFVAKGFGACYPKKPTWFFDILNSSMKMKFLKLFRLGILRLLNTASVFCSCDLFFVRQKELARVDQTSQSYDWAYC